MKRSILLDSKNIAEDIKKQPGGGKKLQDIGAKVVKEYTEDKLSRGEWERQMSQANKLALQVKETKSFPWPNAANVKFPLVTIAALQFSSRIYPAFMTGPNIVKCGILGKDPTGEKKARAERIQTHMSYQLRRENEDWEEDHDRMLFALPIVGSTFKKTYYDPVKGYNCSEYILPDHLVISYKAKFYSAERKTHRLFYTPRQVKERQLRKLYLNVELMDAAFQPDAAQKAQDEQEGTHSTYHDEIHEILEQHRFLDLDDDGYEEPYVVTVNKQDMKVLRIVARYTENDIETNKDGEIKALFRQAQRSVQEMPDAAMEIMKGAESKALDIKRTAKVIAIKPEEYFTRYTLIPNPESGTYGLGFGSLLGPINETVNTALNQLLDAGTLANAGGGWIGKGAKMKGGKIRVAPGRWEQVQTVGGDLKNNLVPYPIKEPSGVLFNLLSLLITYGERIASVTDMMQGQTPGQNTPATTSMAALEQGMKVFQGIFKRVFRSTTKEFRKLYMLNRQYNDPEKYVGLLDEEAEKLEGDYLGDPKDIEPTADETSITDTQKVMKVQALMERAQSVPGYSMPAVERRWLEAYGVADIQEVFPLDEQGNPVIKPPPNPELELEIADQERKVAESQSRAQKDSEMVRLETIKTEADVAVKKADIALKMAQAKSADIEADLKPFMAELKALEVKQKESSNEGKGNT